MKIQTIMFSIKGIRGITLDHLLRPDESQPEEIIEEARPNVQSDEFVKANATLLELNIIRIIKYYIQFYNFISQIRVDEMSSHVL